MGRVRRAASRGHRRGRAPATSAPPRRRRLRRPHWIGEPRQPAARQDAGAIARTGGAHRAWRQPAPRHSTGAHRNTAAGGRRRLPRAAGGVVEPAAVVCIGCRVPSAAWRGRAGRAGPRLHMRRRRRGGGARRPRARVAPHAHQPQRRPETGHRTDERHARRAAGPRRARRLRSGVGAGAVDGRRAAAPHTRRASRRGCRLRPAESADDERRAAPRRRSGRRAGGVYQRGAPQRPGTAGRRVGGRRRLAAVPGRIEPAVCRSRGSPGCRCRSSPSCRPGS